ncbi:MAG TPA: hypothetical protein VGI88_10655 [Verrucomicrobiae bacterium]
MLDFHRFQVQRSMSAAARQLIPGLIFGIAVAQDGLIRFYTGIMMKNPIAALKIRRFGSIVPVLTKVPNTKPVWDVKPI